MLDYLGFTFSESCYIYYTQFTLSASIREFPVLCVIPPSGCIAVESLFFCFIYCFFRSIQPQSSVSVLLVFSQICFNYPPITIIKRYGHTFVSPNFGGIHNSVLCWSTYIAQGLTNALLHSRILFLSMRANFIA